MNFYKLIEFDLTYEGIETQLQKLRSQQTPLNVEIDLTHEGTKTGLRTHDS